MDHYVVRRTFHLGEVGVNLIQGDDVYFDGSLMRVGKTQKTYTAPSLQYAIQVRHLVPAGSEEVASIPSTPPKPAPKIVIEEQENRIVASVRLPPRSYKPETSSIRVRPNTSTEQTAKMSGETAKRYEIIGEQQVVAQIKIAKRGGQEEAPVKVEVPIDVRSKVEDAVNKVAQEAEGEGVTLKRPSSKSGTTTVKTPAYEVVSDASDGVVVGKVKSRAEMSAAIARNEAEARKAAITSSSLTAEEEAALKADIELAKAKRAGLVPAGKPAQVKTGSYDPETAYPEGYPATEHWKRRIEWCKAHTSEETLKAIHAGSAASFQGQLHKEFPDVNFGG